jgi:gas vesicle protein
MGGLVIFSHYNYSLNKRRKNMSQDNGYVKGLFIGLLAGSAVGALVALLYAPKSGKELRKDIKTKTDEYYDETEKFIADAKVKAKDMMNEGKKRSEQLIASAKVKSEELLKNAERIFTEAKSKTGSIVSTGKEVVDGETTKLKTAFKAGIDAYKDTKNQNNDKD